jgi:hypothetical protein
MTYYRYIQSHYILLDHVYTVNAVFVAYLVWFPESQFLYNASFVALNGSVIWTLTIFQIPWVPHQFDRISTIFFNIEPVIVMLAFSIGSCAGRGYNLDIYDSALMMFGSAFVVYLAWAVVSFTITLYVCFDRIDSRGYLITFMYALRLEGASARFIRSLGHRYTKAMYIVLHAGLTGVLFCSGVMARWKAFQIATIALHLAAIAYFGSGYYITYFSRRYKVYLAGLEQKKS